MDNASAAQTTPPGWHPDPHVPGHMRWWSGVQWTEHTQPAAPPAQAPFPVAGQPVVQHTVTQNPVAQNAVAQQAPAASVTAQPESIVQANPSSFFAMGISATYVVIALYTGIVFFGILPAYFGFKAFSNGEKLAPLGIIAAGIAIALAITARSSA